jgi:hypothetical protein
MATSAMDPNLGSIWDRTRRAALSALLPLFYPLFAEQKRNPSKKREGRGLGPRWPPFEYKTEQTTENWHKWWGDNRWDATWAVGGKLSAEKNAKWKYYVALDALSTIFTYNNQPKIRGHNRGGTGEKIQHGGSVGEGQYNHFQGNWIG